MDTLAHGLWAAAAAKGVNLKYDKLRTKKINVWLAAWWGMFPDLFAFTHLFVFLIWQSLFSGGQVEPPGPNSADGNQFQGNSLVFIFASELYDISHSLIVFITVIALYYAFKKKIPWAMGGWIFHILMDIPTHTYDFYPTPFLWPLSDVEASGISWATPWFMIVNYSTLALVFLLVWLWRRYHKSNTLIGRLTK